MYEYLATVDRIVDGDTFDLEVDVGFYLTLRMRVRLAGVNTPELRGAERDEGLSARAFVERTIPVGSRVLVKTYKVGKFGRFIADILYLQGVEEPDAATLRANGTQLASTLLAAGLAERISRD